VEQPDALSGIRSWEKLPTFGNVEQLPLFWMHPVGSLIIQRPVAGSVYLKPQSTASLGIARAGYSVDESDLDGKHLNFFQ